MCFDRCVSDVSDANLSSLEKNCVRDCYFKQQAAYDDLTIFFEQKHMLYKKDHLNDHVV